MLTSLHIRNLAVLEAVEVDFAPGFTVLSGETGAGKSLLVDALALALGARADSGTVRSGAERAEIIATFDVGDNAQVLQWLREHDLDVATECQLRRVVTAEGRSRGYVNGQPAPLEQLRDLGASLVEICGQHAYQSLASRAEQRAMLDAHGRHEALLARVAETHASLAATEAAIAALARAGRDRLARCELLRFQLEELRALGVQPGEAAALERERLLIANAGRLADGITRALERIYDAEDGAAHDLVAAARKDLAAIAIVDPALGPVVDSLEQAGILLAEATGNMRDRLAAIEHDPGRQNTVESRLAAIADLARKHRCEPEHLSVIADGIERELADTDASEERLRQMAVTRGQQLKAFTDAGRKLSEARARAAGSFAAAVTRNLRELGMPAATFSVELQPVPQDAQGPAGCEAVEFLVSVNAGQQAGPVTRVASGGELSRLSLAIQVLAMSANSAPSLVFDEVDAGVGGAVAEIVGQRLRALSQDRQVLCVTHLAQVASQADHHLVVGKAADDRQTKTTVTRLSAAGRVEEIARMLGGVQITERTRAHAREMIATAGRRRAG